jgi:hypothetical protein
MGVDKDRRFPPQLCPLVHGSTFPVRLLREPRYRRLVAYAAGFVPRKTHQDILVEALEAYLDQVAE